MTASLALALLLGGQASPPISYGLPSDFYVAGLREFYPRNNLHPLVSGAFGSDVDGLHVLCIMFKASKNYPPVDPETPGTYIGLEMAVPGTFTGSESGSGGYTAHISQLAYQQNTGQGPAQWFPVLSGGQNPTYGMRAFPGYNSLRGLFIPINPDEDEVVVPIMVRRRVTSVVDVPEQDEHFVTYSDTYYSVNYTIHRHDAHDASMDTRRGYGDPSRDGGVIADPNSALRNLNFGPWVFRGGLFIGNIAWPYQDKSGTARIQLWPQNTSTVAPADRVYATASMFDLGGPPTISGGGNHPYPGLETPILGNFVPVSTDANLGESESTVTWERRWTVYDREDLTPNILPDGSYIADTGDVIYTVSLGMNQDDDCGPGGLFWNFPLTASYPDPNNSYWAYYFTESYQRGVGIITQSESLRQQYSDDDDAGNNNTYGATWRYFASREWESERIAESATFPHSDSAPRVWVIEYTGNRTSGWLPAGWLYSGSQAGP